MKKVQPQGPRRSEGNFWTGESESRLLGEWQKIIWWTKSETLATYDTGPNIGVENAGKPLMNGTRGTKEKIP